MTRSVSGPVARRSSRESTRDLQEATAERGVVFGDGDVVEVDDAAQSRLRGTIVRVNGARVRIRTEEGRFMWRERRVVTLVANAAEMAEEAADVAEARTAAATASASPDLGNPLWKDGEMGGWGRRRMEVLFLVSRPLSESSGGSRYQQEFVEAIKTGGHEVVVMVTDTEANAEEWIRRVRSDNGMYYDLVIVDGFAALLGRRLLDETRSGYSGRPFGGCRSVLIMRSPISATSGGYANSDPSLRSWIRAFHKMGTGNAKDLRQVESTVFSAFDSIITMSPEVPSLLSLQYAQSNSHREGAGGGPGVPDAGGPRLQVIPPGLSSGFLYNLHEYIYTNAKPNRVGPDTGCVKLISVGTVCARKNQHVLVEAVANCACLRPDIYWELTLVGKVDPKYARVLQQIDVHYGNLLDQGNMEINLTGAVDTKSVVSMLSMSDAFVMASYEEGYGVAPLEAAAIGIPIYTPAIGPLPRILPACTTWVHPDRNLEPSAAEVQVWGDVIIGMVGDDVRKRALDAARAESVVVREENDQHSRCQEWLFREEEVAAKRKQ